MGYFVLKRNVKAVLLDDEAQLALDWFTETDLLLHPSEHWYISNSMAEIEMLAVHDVRRRKRPNH